MPINHELILLENELRNFYAKTENKKYFTSADYKWIEENRKEQEQAYEQLVVKYLKKELKFLKSLIKPSLIRRLTTKPSQEGPFCKTKDCKNTRRSGSKFCQVCSDNNKKHEKK